MKKRKKSENKEIANSFLRFLVFVVKTIKLGSLQKQLVSLFVICGSDETLMCCVIVMCYKTKKKLKKENHKNKKPCLFLGS